MQDLNPPETYINSYWVECESCNGYGYTTVSEWMAIASSAKK
jgi:hypothetical protein